MAEEGGGNWWKWCLGVGVALVVAATVSGRALASLPVVANVLLAGGGLLAIAGSCEAMIRAAIGFGGKMRWNEFVAGTIASLASNVPEVVMLGFVVAADVRVAFVVALLTLHINALVFSLFCLLLPRDGGDRASLPKAISVLGADMLVSSAGLMVVIGLLMVVMALFNGGDHAGLSLGRWDLLMIALALLAVLVVYLLALVRRYAGTSRETGAGQAAGERSAPSMSWSTIALYGGLGGLGALIGGHAIGEFAGNLVDVLAAMGHSEMLGAIVIAFLAGVPAYILVSSAHAHGKTDLALSNVFGAIVQVPFVTLPAVLLFAVVLAAFGVVPVLPSGGLLAIDFETVLVVLFAFPTLLVLWQSVGDDGAVNKLETTIMLVLFALVLYLLAMHG